MVGNKDTVVLYADLCTLISFFLVKLNECKLVFLFPFTFRKKELFFL